MFLPALVRGTHFSGFLRSGKIDLFDPGYFWVLGSGKRCPDPALSLLFSRESRIPQFCHSYTKYRLFPVPHQCPNFGESRISGCVKSLIPLKFPESRTFFSHISDPGNNPSSPCGVKPVPIVLLKIKHS